MSASILDHNLATPDAAGKVGNVIVLIHSESEAERISIALNDLLGVMAGLVAAIVRSQARPIQGGAIPLQVILLRPVFDLLPKSKYSA